jgi:raffinose/stachyose/melibiose transport system substrate-binding protein
VTQDNILRRPLSRRQFMAGAAGAAAGFGAASLLNTPLAAASARRIEFGGKSEPILMWASFLEAQQETFWKEQYLNPWNNSHHNMPISLVVKPLNSFAQLQQTAIEAGAGPDIVQEDGSSTVVPLAVAQQILPLDDYAKKYGWKDLILPWAFEASTYKGKLWSLPNSYETMVIYYNPATFEKYGWKPPTTLDETENLMKEAMGKGLQPITAGKADWSGVNEWFVTMMWNHYSGPDALYQALSGQIKWTDPVFVDAIALLQKWFKAGYIGQSSQDYFTTHFATAYNNLVQGKGLMYWSGTWEFANLPLYFGKAGHNDQNWTWANVPQMRSEVPKVLNELSIGGTYSINAKSKYPDAVADFLGWYFANKKAATLGLKDFGNEPPPLPLTASDFAPGTNPNYVRVYDELATNSKAGNIGYTTWTFWPPKSDTYIINSFDGIITGSMSPKSYCAGLQDVFSKELAAKLVPPLFKPRAYAAI